MQRQDNIRAFFAAIRETGATVSVCRQLEETSEALLLEADRDEARYQRDCFRRGVMYIPRGLVQQPHWRTAFIIQMAYYYATGSEWALDTALER